MTTPNLKTSSALTQGLLNTPALLSSGETTVYTVPANSGAKIASASLCNTTTTAVTVSISIVPSSGAAGAANRIISSYQLAAGDTITHEDGLAALNGAMLGDGQFVSVNVGTGSAVTMTLTGVVTS